MAKQVREVRKELRECKHKLEETETELQKEKQGLGTCKRKLEETEAELQKERKRSKQLETQVATGVKFSPIRSKISLTLPNSAELFADKKFFKYSDPVNVAGFPWKLIAKRDPVENGDWLSLGLCLYPPAQYKGPFEFDVRISFRLSNVFPEKDIQMQCTHKYKRGDTFLGWGFPTFIEIEELPNDFVQADGSIQLEVHFTVEVITLDQLLAGAVGNGNGNGNGNQQNGGK